MAQVCNTLDASSTTPGAAGFATPTFGFRFMAPPWSSDAAAYKRVAPWAKNTSTYDSDYDHNSWDQWAGKKQRGAWATRKRRSGRGRAEYVWCSACKHWDWKSHWFPCCPGCGCKWNDGGNDPDGPALALELKGGDKDKEKETDKAKASPFTEQQRGRAMELVKALSDTVGFDLSVLLAQRLPAVQAPKTEKKKSDAVVAKLRQNFAEAEKNNKELPQKADEAEGRRHDLLQGYFATCGQEHRARAEEAACISAEAPVTKKQRAGSRERQSQHPTAESSQATNNRQ